MSSPESRRGDNHHTRRRRFVGTELDEEMFQQFKSIAKRKRAVCARRVCRECKVCRAASEVIAKLIRG
jgi:hypothetical protein